MNRVSYFIFAISLLWTISTCHSQTVSLVLALDEVTNVVIPSYTDALYDAEINLEDMRELPETLEVRLLNDGIITVSRTDFAARAGYDYNDSPLPPFTVSPNAELSDMEYFWAGSNEDRGNEVVMTVVGTRMHASIWSDGKKYSITPGSEESTHRMFELNGCIFCPAPQSVNTLSLFSLLFYAFMIMFCSLFFINNSGIKFKSRLLHK